MATKRQQASPRDRLIDAALRLAAERPWDEVTLGAIAEEAKLPLAVLYAEFGSRGALLAAYARRIDAAVLSEEDAEALADSPARDRLFEVLMRRFEAMQPHRAAVASILSDRLRRPGAGLAALPQLGRSMAWMLVAAGISTDGWRGLLRIKGLSALWLATLRVWLRDDSEDMAKTMAALDRNLQRAESLLQRLPRRRPGVAETAEAAGAGEAGAGEAGSSAGPAPA